MYNSKITNYENLGNSVCKALNSHGFKAQYAASAEDARNAVLALIPDGASVGIGGSVSVRETGVMEALEAKGCKIAHHWKPGMSPEERKQALLDEFNSDWYLASANAITKDGVIVNIDGTGNRVAVMSWAPGKIIYIVGVNKIASGLECATERARNIASPPNARRTGADTPCAKLGYCVDCDSPRRICNIITIMPRCPLGRECHVIIVGESLGY